MTAWVVPRAAASATAHSMPPMMSAASPCPLQSSTCTATTVAPLATPYSLPATVDATCVPWPEKAQSFALLAAKFSAVMSPYSAHSVQLRATSLHRALHPGSARPSKSSCDVRTPVSST